MRNSLRLAALTLILFSISGCLVEKENGPPSEKLKSTLLIELIGASFLELKEFNVVASDNVGTSVEPIIKSRIDADFTIKDDFYKPDGYINDTTIVSMSEPSGKTVKVSAITESTPRGEGWDVRVTKLDYLNHPSGAPLYTIKEDYVINNSPEHKELIAAEKERQREIKARAQEEEKRLAEEKEAREEEERLANEKLKKELQNAKQKLAGQWETRKFLLLNGKYYKTKVNWKDSYLKYRVEIPENDDIEGPAKVIIISDPDKESFEIDAHYAVSGPSQITIQEQESKKIGDWTTGDKWVFSYNNNTLTASFTNRYVGGRTDKFEIALNKD